MPSAPRSAGEPACPPAAPGSATGRPDGAWVRRFVAAPPRLQEMVELYRSLGLEVRLEPLGPEELAAECEGCEAAVALFRVIYTRRRS